MLELDGWRLGISICEDVWNDRDFWQRRRYHHDPIEVLTRKGAQAISIFRPRRSPSKSRLLRERMLSQMAGKYGLPLLIVNQVGRQ